MIRKVASFNGNRKVKPTSSFLSWGIQSLIMIKEANVAERGKTEKIQILKCVSYFKHNQTSI